MKQRTILISAIIIFMCLYFGPQIAAEAATEDMSPVYTINGKTYSTRESDGVFVLESSDNGHGKLDNGINWVIYNNGLMELWGEQELIGGSNSGSYYCNEWKWNSNLYTSSSSLSYIKAVVVKKDENLKLYNCKGMFYKCYNLEALDLSSFDTSSVTDMSYMFSGCSGLKTLDLSDFDTSSVTDMSYMFYDCSNINTLILNGFDMSNITNMDKMFYNCSNIKSLDLSNTDIRYIIGNKTMKSFLDEHFPNLKSLNLSNGKASRYTSLGSMFYNCSSLESINLSGFDTTGITNMKRHHQYV